MCVRFQADKASMLDEIIDYVKFLQLQVKVLSMSRLGGAAAVAPLVADMSSEVVTLALSPSRPALSPIRPAQYCYPAVVFLSIVFSR